MDIPPLKHFLAVWILLFATTAPASAMDLRWAGNAAGTNVLEVAGAPDGLVNLEGSFDLENWFLLGTQPTAGGRAQFISSQVEPVGAQFYRATVRPVTPSPDVGAEPDPTSTVALVVTPAEGGELVATDRRGILYQLVIGTNLVSEPTTIAMTVVTNFTHMPFEDRFRAAVIFEPEGLEFRGTATLRIRFPDAIPENEMVGYGFEGRGAGLLLQPWESGTHDVILPVTHFSGAGTVAVPLPPAPQPRMDFEQVRRSTRDADRQAGQWAGEQYRKLQERRHRGELSDADFKELLSGVKTLRDRMFYLTGIRPLLEAATRQCDVGELVLRQLDQMEAGSGNPYGTSLQFQELRQLAPKVRCRCAHEYIENCERNPTTSGRSSRDSLTRVLDTTARITGRTDAQDCDLGTDTEISRRFAKAACHKPWEGRVSFTEEHSEVYELSLPDTGSGTLVTSNVRRTVTGYSGILESLLETDGDVPDENGEGGWAYWRLKLKGKISGSHGDSQITVVVTRDYTSTDSSLETGRQELPATGTLSLRINDGSHVGWVEFSAGLDEEKYPMARSTTSGLTVECQPGRERFCPESRPSTTRNSGTSDLSFAAYASDVSKDATITFDGDQVKVKYRRVRITSAPKPAIQTNTTIETWSATLWRGSPP